MTASAGCSGTSKTAARREPWTMKFILRSRKSWESTQAVESTTMPGVRYRLGRMSLGRRNALIRSIRELAQKMDFHAAGGVEERLESSALALEIDAAYLRWG